MQQLIGYAGQRRYLAIKLAVFTAIVAFGVLDISFVYPLSKQSSTIPWFSTVDLLLTGMLFAIFMGLYSRSMLSVAIRLGFSRTWWINPLAISLATLGSTITLLMFSLPQDLMQPYRVLIINMPAILGWLIAIFLIGIVIIKDVGVVIDGKAKASARRDALNSIAAKYPLSQFARLQRTCDADNFLLSDNLLPNPKGRPMYGLSSKPWYEVEEFSWLRELEENFEVIRSEALNALGEDSEYDPYHYPGINKGGWTALSFVTQGKENSVNLSRCPKTAELLKRFPRYPHFRDAMFSLLEPHADIDRHQDYHNVYLTCHLGLKIPENAYIQVAGIEKKWQEGKCLVFDSSYTHSAHNHDNNPRLILLVDFLHPDINDAELDWLEQVGLA